MKLSSILLIAFGLFCVVLGDYYFWEKNNPENLSFKDYPVKNINVESNSKAEVSKSLPVGVTIEELNINLPIIPAKVENSKWETTHDGASYLVSSPIPGDKGNSIIYGHNWTKLFGNLIMAKPGQDIKIDYADGTQKRFIIKSTNTVLPTDPSVLASSDDQRITLYTCTGFLDTKRFVAVAYLDKNPSFAEIRR